MASSVKASGTWRSISGLSVKVSGTWRTATAGYVKIAGVWKQWFAAFITDNFNRSTSGTLGTSSSGANWSTLSGTWYANGGQAQSDTAASSYPLATVGWGAPSTTASASVVSGTGVAFWVSDAGSWWAAVSYNNSSSYSYSCNPYSCNCVSCNCSPQSYACNPYPCNPYQCNCNTTCTTCPSGYTYNGSAYFPGYCAKGPYTNGYPAAIASPSCTTTCSTCYDTCYQTCTQTVCGTCCSTCYQTCSGTSYNYYLRLLNSVSGTVSVATGDVSLGSQAAAIWVNTNGDVITAKAYSDTAMTSQLGSDLVYTATSPTKGPAAGVIKAPSDYNQGSTVDDLAIGL